MKTTLPIIAAASLLLTFNHLSSTARAQGTAFTYQGQLQNTNGPVHGTYNFSFSLFNTNINGVAIGGPVTVSGVVITNGLFTVALDFGSSAWNGQTNWLQIAVETNGASSFTNLSPRQQLTPTPYAIFANTASNVLGTVLTEQLSGTLLPAQLPGVVITNGEPSVTLSNVTLSGVLTLPSAGAINAGGSSLLHVDGSDNFYAGPGAGSVTTSGSGSTGIGFESLQNNVNGINNTAVGDLSLNSNINGAYNAAVGERALLNNTSGSDNSAVGRHALENNAIGNDNTASGFDALQNNTNSDNTADGSQALENNTSGSQNTASGYETLQNNTSGTANTANGASALAFNTNGTQNTAIGNEALDLNQNGSFNTAIGSAALAFNTNSYNTAVGAAALIENTSGTANTANGFGALNMNTNGSENTAMGFEALAFSTSDNQLVAIGYQALQNDNAYPNVNTLSGNGENTAVGADALQLNTLGYANTALGCTALSSNINGAGNTALGDEAMQYSVSANNNTAVGYGALRNLTSGSGNIAIGINSADYGAGGNLFSGNNDIDIGNEGVNNDSGITRIGTTGQQTYTYLAGNVEVDNTLNVDRYGLNTGTIATNALVFGASSATPFSGEGIASKRVGPNPFDLEFYTDYTNRVTIVNNGNVGIGTTNPDALLSVNGTADKPGGGSWNTFSDGRLKDVGANFTHGLEALAEIQPVHYHYKADNALNLPSQPDYVGVVAQQVQSAIPEAVHRNQDGYLVVNNDPIIWTMFNAIKELDQKRDIEDKANDLEIQILKQQNQTLKQQNDSLAERLNDLTAMVKALEQKNGVGQ